MLLFIIRTVKLTCHYELLLYNVLSFVRTTSGISRKQNPITHSATSYVCKSMAMHNATAQTNKITPTTDMRQTVVIENCFLTNTQN